MRYITETKNLFDISKLQAYTPETLPTNTAGVYNGTIIARAGVNSSVCESGKKLKELCPELVAGETYLLSFETSAKSYTIYLRGANEYWYKNTSSVVTEAMLDSLVGFYANYPDITVATISNFQIEKGSTATPYVPYGYLPMRRMKYRVNEYCQLLKPNFLSGQSAGVTVTSNGDTFTVNGTSTKRTTIGTAVKNWTPIIGHKILVCGCPEGGGNNTFAIGAFNQSGNLDYGKGNIDKVVTTGTWFGILFESGITFNNLVFKPQLFDLTEMYGAGNEPTTVEQFRQDYPNELYEYSPYCWASMKNIRYVTTTKNLFDSEDWYNTLHAINSTSMVKETVDGIEYYKFRPQEIYDYGYMKGKFKENTVYTLSFLGMNEDGSNNKYTGLRFYYTDGTRDSYYINTGEEQKNTITSSSNKTIDSIQLSYNAGKYVLVRNIQLEEGSTATEYVPYGYLPLK